MKFASLTADACYQAMKAHDVRFDGHFFVGVSSTGIYCRPICRVRLPRQENCSFHSSAAAAEAAGYRPCLRCRPELAPGFAATEASVRLARTAASLIEDGAGNAGIDGLAARIGVSPRHLRRIFVDEFGVSPVQYAQTQRLLLAKRLLTDTVLPVADVAFASGFASVRRMNALFLERYSFSPGHLRKQGEPGISAAGDAITLLLPYRPPYDFGALLEFLSARTVPGVESVADGAYRRIVRTPRGNALGWLEVTQVAERNALCLRLDAGLAGATQSILARTKRVFDVAADPVEIAEVLGPLAATSGLRLPGAFDPFELALRAILGQQVTVKAARTLATRFVAAFGTEAASPFSELTRAFPSAARVASLSRDEIAALGIVGSRADAMIAVARALESGTLQLDGSADVDAVVDALCAIRGIGMWTARYVAMRALAWPDAWLSGDVALSNALGLPKTAAGFKQADAQAEQWRPWRSYAVLHLWRQLASTKDLT